MTTSLGMEATTSLLRSSRVLQTAFFASLPTSILASAYMPRRRPRWHRVPSAHSRAVSILSLNERLVREPLSGGAVNEAVEPHQGVVLDVALIKPKRKFVNVAVQMFRAGVMIDANQAALQDGEDAFDAIGRHFVANIFVRTVIDGFVVLPSVSDADICAVFVSMQRRSSLDVRVDFRLNRPPVGSVECHRYRAPPALAHSKNGRFSNSSAPRIQFLAFMLIRLLAANIGFVNLNYALKFFEFRTARFAKAVQNEPRRFLRNADFLRKLHGRNTLAGRHKQVHRVNPLMKRNVRPLENRAGANREVLFALIAAIEALLADRDALAKSANCAFHGC